jgi:hypothetical protein
MTTPTRKVLDMLLQGTIDADQAEQLLGAMTEPAAPVRRPSRPAGDRAGMRLTVDDLVELSSNGVDADYVKALAAAGMRNLTVPEIVELAGNGVEADYVRDLMKAGLEDLTIEEIVELAGNDVDPKLAESFRRALSDE